MSYPKISSALGLLVLATPAIALARPTAPVTVFLDGRGAVLEGGEDDAANDVSWIASSGRGGSTRVPAWTGGDRKWSQVLACVRDQFSDFAVDVVDRPPAGDDHIRIMVGGKPSLIGGGRQLSGIAPFDGRVLRGAVGFVFSASLNNDPHETCEAIAHEAGHTLGLEHSLACDDIMSYDNCGEKRFRVEEAPCGEGEARECSNGKATQSSYQTLARLVGLRNHPATWPDDEADPGDQGDDESDEWVESDDDESTGDADSASDEVFDDSGATDADDPDDDGACPYATSASPSPRGRADRSEVSFARDDSTLPGNRTITLTVRARAATGVSDVMLAWISDQAELMVSCASPPEDGPISCRRDGDQFHFRIRAGVGPRQIAAAAFDQAGGHVVTKFRQIWLDGAK